MRDEDQAAGISPQAGETGGADQTVMSDQIGLANDGELTGAVNAEGEQGDAVTLPADEEEPAAEEAAAQLGDFA